MKYFDALFPLGRTNGAVKESPSTEEEALALMDRFSVEEALVFSTAARDVNPDIGNAALTSVRSSRFHRVFAFDTAYTARRSPALFLDNACGNGAKAILVNPGLGEIRVSRSPRLAELAALVSERSMPLIVAHPAGLDWYDLADLCVRFPDLCVLAWEQRSRSNRPLFDALSLAPNLIAILSSIWQSQMVEAICNHFGADRLVFSLGLPGLHAASFPAVVSYAHISDQDREAIACGNLQRMLQGGRS